MNICKKILILVLCLALLCVPLFSFFYIVGHINHECTGSDCPICAQIETSIHNIKDSKTFYIAALCILIVVVTTAFICPAGDVIYHSSITLISLKVELLN